MGYYPGSLFRDGDKKLRFTIIHDSINIAKMQVFPGILINLITLSD